MVKALDELINIQAADQQHVRRQQTDYFDSREAYSLSRSHVVFESNQGSSSHHRR